MRLSSTARKFDQVVASLDRFETIRYADIVEKRLMSNVGYYPSRSKIPGGLTLLSGVGPETVKAHQLSSMDRAAALFNRITKTAKYSSPEFVGTRPKGFYQWQIDPMDTKAWLLSFFLQVGAVPSTAIGMRSVRRQR